MPNTRANPEWDVILEVTGPAYWLDKPHHEHFKKVRLTRNEHRQNRESTEEEEMIKLILKFSTPPRNVGVLCHIASQIAPFPPLSCHSIYPNGGLLRCKKKISCRYVTSRDDKLVTDWELKRERLGSGSGGTKALISSSTLPPQSVGAIFPWDSTSGAKW